MSSAPEPLAALRRYWGYDSFRPLQERIVHSLLENRDVCVVMPTGGGKSLCYQLPAALLSRQTVLVISPLIALMQDQVAQLTQMGIPSAALNSSLAGAEQAALMRRAANGEYRLIYISPERLARQETIQWLQRIPISFFAIDEAHCISEWGHEFRPEYRQLNCLRVHFPDRPLAAFTASATQRVRHDILEQLQLRSPRKYIASFHRSNLRYIVKECTGRTQPNLLVTALGKYPEGNIIVYAPTIVRVEETVDYLEERGIPAIAYHGKMDAETRRTNQERWMSDEVRVLVGTIAFGLGINKAAVRAVIHLSLPQSIEQYYQEAGRAGRDGNPADCLLLWQKRDAGLLAHFIEKVSDDAERHRAWQRYHEIRGFAESKHCRHHQICMHFGENPKWKTCQACDVCGSAPEWLFGAGAVELETPAEMPKRTKPPAPSAAPSRSQAVAAKSQRSEVELDPDLRAYLREWREETAKRQGVPEHVVMHDTSLDELETPAEMPKRTKPPAPSAAPSRSQAVAAKSQRSEVELDPGLRDYLREWRRETAKRQGVPAYVVMHDTSLEELCRIQPTSLSQLVGVYGFGERKTQSYGQQILDALKKFRAGARATAAPAKKAKPADETIRLLSEGRTFEEIARIRGRQLQSVIDLVANLVQRGDLEFESAWIDPEKRVVIEAACARLGIERLKPLKDALPPEITFQEIQLVVASIAARESGIARKL